MINTVSDLLEYLYKNGNSEGIVSINSDLSAQDAAAAMSANKINLLAIKRKGRFVGVVSSADTNTVFGTGEKPLISDIMTKKVIRVEMDDKVNDLPKILSQSGIRHLVVVDKRRHWRAILSSNEVLVVAIANYDEEELLQAHVLGELGHHT